MKREIGRARPWEPDSLFLACLAGLLVAREERRAAREIHDLTPWAKVARRRVVRMEREREVNA